MLVNKENRNSNTTLKNNSTKILRNLTSPFLNERRIRKKCVGCCDTFTCSQAKNYDYCRDCELNGSRYVPRENKCPECGDGKGIVKFPHQPPRNCKLCYLAHQEERRENNFAKNA